MGVLRTLNIKPEAVIDNIMIAAYLLDSTRSGYSVQQLAQIHLDMDPATDVPEGFTEFSFRTCERADFIFRLAACFKK